MTALLLLCLFAASDPCRQDTSGWKVVRHGTEEIRYRREGQAVLLAVRNHGRQPAHVDVVWRELGFSGAVRVFDITGDKDEGKVQSGFAKKLAPGACAAYRLQVE
jgi:hypothetical protein